LVAISYVREVARVVSISQYLGSSSSRLSESALPLRVLLAKQLVERNGGRMTVDQSESEGDTVKMEFPIA
jgi:hypothetical protein